MKIVDSPSIIGMVFPWWGTLGLDPMDISDRADLIQNLVLGINSHENVVEGVAHDTQIFRFDIILLPIKLELL